MKDRRRYPLVLIVTAVGSSSFSTLTEDVIDIILSVLITLFENTMSRVQIRKIETKPPNIVPYSGYFL
jgi:hypothetical protein